MKREDSGTPAAKCPNPGCDSIVRSQRRQRVCVMSCPPENWKWITDGRLTPTEHIECCHPWHEGEDSGTAPMPHVGMKLAQELRRRCNTKMSLLHQSAWYEAASELEKFADGLLTGGAVGAVPEKARQEEIMDESGWLIEKGQLCLGSCDRKPAWVTFTDPSAVRFARKIDAENMLNSLRSMGKDGAFEKCTISEHMWVDRAAPAVESAATPDAEPSK